MRTEPRTGPARAQRWSAIGICTVGLCWLMLFVGGLWASAAKAAPPPAAAAPPGTPTPTEAEIVRGVKGTIVMVYSDTVTGDRFEPAIEGLVQMGCPNVLLHARAWHPGSALFPRVREFVAACHARGILVGVHVAPSLWGQQWPGMSHDAAMAADIALARSIAATGLVYCDDAELVRFAEFEPLQLTDIFEFHRRNHRHFVWHFRDGLGRPPIVMSSSNWYACELLTRYGTGDIRDAESLIGQSRDARGWAEGVKRIVPAWCAVDYGWIGSVATDGPCPTFPTHEYVHAWLDCWSIGAGMHFQTNLEWLGRPGLEVTRRAIGEVERARAAREYGAASLARPQAPPSPAPQPPVIPPPPPATQPTPKPKPLPPVFTPAAADPWKLAGVEPLPAWSQVPVESASVVMTGTYGLSAARGGAIRFDQVGTAERPVVIDARKATFTQGLLFEGDYIVLIGGVVDGVPSGPGITITGDFIAVRGVEVLRGSNMTTSAISIRGQDGTRPGPTPGSVRDRRVDGVVVQNCKVHRNGDWRTTIDQDHHGIGVGAWTRNIWIVGNELFNNSGNGVQINAGTAGLAGTLGPVWVIGNEAYANKQDALWAKQSTDVLIAGNRVWDTLPSPSSPMGAGIGGQYGPVRLRVYYNQIEGCASGVVIMSKNDGSQEGLQIAGNAISGLVAVPPLPGVGADWQAGAAVFIADGVGAVLRGNTLDGKPASGPPAVRVARGAVRYE